MSLSEKRYYEMGAAGYLGVFMPENVMKKIVKICTKYQAEVQRILSDHKEELLRADWTLANHMDGEKIEKQIVIKYAISNSAVDDRIKLFSFNKPKYVDQLYIVSSYEEANAIAKELINNWLEEQPNDR